MTDLGRYPPRESRAKQTCSPAMASTGRLSWRLACCSPARTWRCCARRLVGRSARAVCRTAWQSRARRAGSTEQESLRSSARAGGGDAAADAVRFTGYVEDADLPALYRAADAFAYPSLYEGLAFLPSKRWRAAPLSSSQTRLRARGRGRRRADSERHGCRCLGGRARRDAHGPGRAQALC